MRRPRNVLDWPKLQEAIRKELDSLEKMGTWQWLNDPLVQILLTVNGS